MKLKTVRLPCGICITATVIPALISPGKSHFSEYFGNHFNTGIKFKMNWIRLKFSHDRFTLLISEMNAINFHLFFKETHSNDDKHKFNLQFGCICF